MPSFPRCATPRTGAAPFAGGDLEARGVIDAAFAARAPDRELVFLSVGDTRDHRRQHKDPALRTISTDFLLNLIANLRQLDIEHFFVLTTEPLCRALQEKHCLYACGWTSLWGDHRGLQPWGLKQGDMFLMWAQQWHYVSRALEMGYSVLRADTDVYFAESPYPILHGPLLSPFSMVVQQDFGGPLGSRPSCRSVLRPRHSETTAGDPASGSYLSTPASGSSLGGAAARSTPASCGAYGGTALLNIGLVYARARPGGSPAAGGALAVINGTWARFLNKLSEERAGPAAQPQHVESLIDQPLMRSLVSELSIAHAASKKPAGRWMAVPGSAAPVYAADASGGACALRDAAACAAVASERARTSFLAQLVRPKHQAGGREEWIALAPDWLFGRGCLTHVRQPAALLRLASSARLPASGAPDDTICRMPPAEIGRAMPAPGPAAGLLVATHFVYSMALKRKRTFRAFGWDDARGRNRSAFAPGTCWARSQTGILFGHTFFAQTKAKSVLCALPSERGLGPECSCCIGLGSLQEAAQAEEAGNGGATRLETTSGRLTRWSKNHAAKIEGCGDYQLFWDR